MSNPAFDLIGLTALRADPRFSGLDGSGVTVAVIDTGLDFTHPLLQGNYLAGYDFIDNDNTPNDLRDHGTHVSGTVGATDPNIGVAPDVGLIGLKVFGAQGGATNSDIEEALDWVLDHRVQYNIVAVNMSLGAGFFTNPAQASGQIFVDDIERLEQAGITVVAAGGNSYKGNEYPNFGSPAIVSTIAVGAVWEDGSVSNISWGSGAVDYTTGADRITSFSQRLQAPNTLFAPGALILSTVPGGGLEQMGGTSMASPMVAGAVAVLQEAALQFGGRLLTPAEVVDILESTAHTIFDGDDENDNVVNTQLNYPRLDIYAAVNEVVHRFSVIAPAPGNGVGDANGTLIGAVTGPALDGSAVTSFYGQIGTDGAATTVGPSDVDMFAFTVAVPGTVTIETSADPNGPGAFDTQLRLFNSNGTEIGFDDDSGEGNFSLLQSALPTGTYYVGVSGYNNRNYDPNVAGSGVAGATGAYQLKFSLASGDPNGLIGGAVAVNLGNNREPLLFQGSIGFDYGQPVGAGDVDIFRIVVPDDGRLVVDIDTPYPSDFVDSFVRVFDANGVEVAFDDDSLAFGALIEQEYADPGFPGLVFEDPFDRTFASGHTIDSFLAGQVFRGEVYYIAVSDYYNQTYNPYQLGNRSAAGTGGLYDLIVTFANNDLNGSITQAVDNIALPLRNQPGIIGADGDTVSGELSEVGDRDVDFFHIRPTSAGILEVDVDAYGSSQTVAPVDAILLLFDANGNLLSFNDDTDGFDPLLQVPVAAGTDYYVAVAGYGNDSFDPFQLGSGSSGDTGDYYINVRLLPQSQALVFSDNVISGGAVQTVQVGATISAALGTDGGFAVGPTDVDLYRFVAPYGGGVAIHTVTSDPFSADTYLRFFTAAGVQLAANNDESAETRSSAVFVDIVAGQTYYIGVNGSGPALPQYDPVTGQGTTVGSEGVYGLTIEPVGAATISGDDGANQLSGGAGFDYLLGGGGNDTIFGRGDTDIIIAGSGNDIMTGDLAAALGDGGDDVIYAGAGNDVVICQEGNDQVDGGDGNDTIGSFLGTASLAGGNGNDVLLLADGSGTIDGGAGNDTIGIFAGHDLSLRGGDGDDVFFAGGGVGQAMEGGAGSDILVGGPGADLFLYRNGFGPADNMYGFNRAQGDRIVLSPSINGTGITTGAQALAFASTPPGFEGSTLLSLGGGLIVVVGVPQLFATDFIIG